MSGYKINISNKQIDKEAIEKLFNAFTKEYSDLWLWHKKIKSKEAK